MINFRLGCVRICVIVKELHQGGKKLKGAAIKNECRGVLSAGLATPDSYYMETRGAKPLLSHFYFLFFLNLEPAKPNKPVQRRSIVAGSGTGAVWFPK